MAAIPPLDHADHGLEARLVDPHLHDNELVLPLLDLLDGALDAHRALIPDAIVSLEGVLQAEQIPDEYEV